MYNKFVAQCLEEYVERRMYWRGCLGAQSPQQPWILFGSEMVKQQTSY